jgi:hypothetical protein
LEPFDPGRLRWFGSGASTLATSATRLPIKVGFAQTVLTKMLVASGLSRQITNVSAAWLPAKGNLRLLLCVVAKRIVPP